MSKVQAALVGKGKGILGGPETSLAEVMTITAGFDDALQGTQTSEKGGSNLPKRKAEDSTPAGDSKGSSKKKKKGPKANLKGGKAKPYNTQGRLSKEEWEKHLKEGRCFICHQTGHMSGSCPQKGASGDAPKAKSGQGNAKGGK